MNAWTRANLLLAALVVVLAVLNRWPPGLAPTAPPTLTMLDPQQVHELRVLQGRRLTLALLRDRDGWQLTHPDIARADPRRVASLLAILSAPDRQPLTIADGDLARYGLATPAWTLQADQVPIAFGAEAPLDGLRYALVAGKVHLIDGVHYHLLSLPARRYLLEP